MHPGPVPMVPGRVEVGMRRIAARLADELRLAPSIRLRAMTAGAAGLAGVGRIGEPHRHSRQLPFVDDEAAQLIERPSVVPVSLLPANCDPLADALEVLQGDPATGAFGRSDEPLADLMVDVPPEP